MLLRVLTALLAGCMVWYVLQHLASAVLLMLHHRRNRRLLRATHRRVSVLVPARNEATNIRRCLDRLLAQDYPAHLLEIIVGNDRSEDGTGQIVRAYIAEYQARAAAAPATKRRIAVGLPAAQSAPYPLSDVAEANGFIIRCIDIPDNFPGQQGKQNVLAHLAHHATGELLLCTDADIAVAPDWVALATGVFQDQDVGMYSGPTLVEGEGLFPNLQRLDWLYGAATFQGYALAGYPVSAVGNNMAVTREAYEATGRYENLPFSITEDYRLFEAVRKAGYKVRFLFHPDVVNRSQPIPDWRTYLHQRKRWYRGGREAPFSSMMIFYVQAATAPVLLLSLFLLPWQWGLAALVLKLVSDFTLLWSAADILLPRKLRWNTLAWFPLHALYFLGAVLFFPFYLALPGKVVWKGRPI